MFPAACAQHAPSGLARQVRYVQCAVESSCPPAKDCTSRIVRPPPPAPTAERLAVNGVWSPPLPAVVAAAPNTAPGKIGQFRFHPSPARVRTGVGNCTGKRRLAGNGTVPIRWLRGDTP